MSAKATSPRLTIKQAAEAFGVTTMTIFTWRKGTPTREPLPVEIENPDAIKSRVFVPVASAKAWARSHQLPFDPTSGSRIARTTKPGPKPKTEKTVSVRKGRERH